MQSSSFRTYIYLFAGFLAASCFFGCKSDEEANLDGFWKVMSVELPNKTSIAVDSQFYGFERKYVFSFTRLVSANDAAISYGYVDYPEKGKVHIEMDKNHVEVDFAAKSKWKNTEATFTIKTLSGNQLILEKGDTLFILKRH